MRCLFSLQAFSWDYWRWGFGFSSVSLTFTLSVFRIQRSVENREHRKVSRGTVSRSPRWSIRLSSSLVEISFGSLNPHECMLVYIRGDVFSREIALRKARGRELAPFDEKSTISRIAEPYLR